MIILGGGGHAGVLAELLGEQGAVIAGISLPRRDEGCVASLHGQKRFTDAELPENVASSDILLVNGVGSVTVNSIRKKIYQHFKSLGFNFASVIHPRALISGSASLGEGVQVMAGAVVQSGCAIQANCLLNTSCTLDHDCRVEKHVHLASGATVCGGVMIGENSHVGAGATIIQGIRLGANCLVAAGAVVVRDVPEGATVMGVPAEVVQR